MQPMIYSFDAPALYTEALCQALDAQAGQYEMRAFPDGETYVRVLDDCSGRHLILLTNLHEPDRKFMPLALLAETLRDLGAASIVLATPYLPYMRQDIRFKPGEGITSRYFARLISGLFDGLITIDPHLHRYDCLSEIYSIPSQVVHADRVLARWIANQVPNPVIVGPDSESEQWVRQVAELVGCDVLVLEKVRHGDRDVQIQIPELNAYRTRTPVLVDDIISTGRTMLRTAQQLVDAGLPAPYCIGIHGVFAPGAFEEMQTGAIAQVVTANSIPHASNAIELQAFFAEEIRSFLSRLK